MGANFFEDSSEDAKEVGAHDVGKQSRRNERKVRPLPWGDDDSSKVEDVAQVPRCSHLSLYSLRL